MNSIYLKGILISGWLNELCILLHQLQLHVCNYKLFVPRQIHINEILLRGIEFQMKSEQFFFQICIKTH